MAISNRERVGKALDLLRRSVPFVERELKAVHGDQVGNVAREGQPPERGKRSRLKPELQQSIGTQGLLAVTWNQWNQAFNRTLGQPSEALSAKFGMCATNGHTKRRSAATTPTVPWTAWSVCSLPFRRHEASEIGQMRMDLLRVQFDEQRRGEMRKASFTPTEGKPQGGLKPWRES